MSEWWTYRPADLLMFAPRTYWRLFELQNQALWPLPLLTTLVFLAVGLGLLRRSDGALRAGLAAMALCWALVAWSFLWRRYAPISPVSAPWAWVFGVQVIGLLALAASPGLHTTGHTPRRRFGFALMAWALLLYPLQALLAGRPLVQAEVFGFAPDPTAIGGLGLLLCVHAGRQPARALLWAAQGLAMTWCLFSAATFWTMGAWQGWVPMFATVLALAVRWRWPHRADRPSPGTTSRR